MTESRSRDLNDFAIGAIVFERFRILEPIASGAKGRVYRAVDTILDTEVALKVMLSDARNERDLVRFQSEAKLASKMNHQNIAKINDFGLYNDIPFLSMEFVAGESLDQLLKRKKTLTIPEFLEVFFQVCDALIHAHKQSIVHRDIKPGNIAISERPNGSWKVKVLDFGIAKLLDERPDEAGKLTPTGNLVGSPFYMSPEQGQGLEVTTRSDNYALGCVMWHCLTGEPPFQSETVLETITQHIQSPPPKLNVDSDHPITENFAAVLEGLLSKGPHQRPDIETTVVPALVELQDSLDREIEKSSQTDAEKSIEEKSLKSKKSRFDLKLVILMSAILLTAAGFGIATVVNHTSSQEKLPPVSAPVPDRWFIETVDNFAQSHTDDQLADAERTTLHLSGNCTDEHLRQLANNQFLKKLELIETDFDDRVFPLLAKIPNLEAVDLSATQVSKLTNVGSCKKLIILDLKATQISDSSLEQLRPLTELRTLKLNDTKITDKGIARLVKILPKLSDLDLTRTPITSKASDSLAELPWRARMILNGTDIDLQAAKKILRGPRMFAADFKNCPKISSSDVEQLRVEFPSVGFGDTPSLETTFKQEIDKAQASGDIPLQMAKTKELLELMRKRFGEVDDERVSTLYASVASLYSQIREEENSLIYANKAIAIAKHMNNPVWLRDIYTLKATSLTRLKRYAETAEALEQAIKCEEIANGPETDWALSQTLSLGGALREAGQVERAITTFDKLASVYKRKRGLNSLEYSSTLLQLGNCYLRLKKFDLADQKFSFVASRIKADPQLWKEGVPNAQAVTTYNALCQLELIRGNTKQALQLSNIAMERMKNARLPLVDRIALTTQHGLLLDANGLTREAAEFKRKASVLIELRNKRSESKREKRQAVGSKIREGATQDAREDAPDE
ncbi:protein kinase [Candidatus Obscuribacterales bacterium]|nr:protein kinase [Candidatus Obscuribacterales bacterium]